MPIAATLLMLFLGAVTFAVGLVLYLLPTWLAVLFEHPRALAIFLLNLFAGWTFVGWVAALVWALRRDGAPIIHEEEEEEEEHRRAA
jgi:type VI protein secretion system component VasK